MWWFIVTFFIGMAVGRWKWLPTAMLRRSHLFVIPALSILLLILGEQIGSRHSLIQQLPTIGFHSIVITVLAMVGSALCALCSARFFMGANRHHGGGEPGAREEQIL